MKNLQDGPRSPLFTAIRITGNISFARLAAGGGSTCTSRAVDPLPILSSRPLRSISVSMREAVPHALRGDCTLHGIPFSIGRPVLVTDKPVRIELGNVKVRRLLFLHTSDLRPETPNKGAFISPTHGPGRLAEQAADYVFVYADGTEERAAIRRRREVGAFTGPWGENCTECVSQLKPCPRDDSSHWGMSQTRVDERDMGPWTNWIWAWENPWPRKAVRAVRVEPAAGALVISGVTAAATASSPLRWRPRRKALLKLPKGQSPDTALDAAGCLRQIRIDLGQVISATPRLVYPNASWSRTYNNQIPAVSDREVIVEYTSHPEARFHLENGRTVPVARVEDAGKALSFERIAPAHQRVTVCVVDKQSGKPVPVKLHIHGEAGEYLPPVDRHRLPNAGWFEDYSADFVHKGIHRCAYISGESLVDLPLGRVYLEVSKGFEMRPVRKTIRVTRATRRIRVEIEKVLPWRERGWVSADTHVHFLSPPTARLEGSAEGVNIVNLLASQWGELMTNVGDFDGATTFGSREHGGDGEHLVRVGTENRQHVLGHISLLGYNGDIIAPMTTGGPSESAIGDPVEVLLTEWARQCKRQGGVVVIPHFPNPRLENAAALVSGGADAVEMTTWGELYMGIDPYSLSDWYRYLNCGYMTAAVGGTDKMSACTPVGGIRTYAWIPPDREFTYDEWKDAVRRAETFVTVGPLVEFAVDGWPMGTRLKLSSTGGTVEVTWRVATATMPISRVELVVNGEVVDGAAVSGAEAEGRFSSKLDRSSWVALLVRGHYRDKPEIIAAHTSPVMVEVAGTSFYAAADAMTILEQIEGAIAYLDTLACRGDEKTYKRMRMVLISIRRTLHNRMHEEGQFHGHSPLTDHAEHH